MDFFMFFLTLSYFIYFTYVVRKEHLFSLVSFFYIFIVLLYIIIPFIDVVAFNKKLAPTYSTTIAISFVILSVGIFFGGRTKTFKSRVLIKLDEQREVYLLYFVLSMSLFALFIYIQSFGGLMAALINGAKLRYTQGGTQSIGKWGFLLFFVALAKIVACVSFYRLLSSKNNKWHHRLLLIVGVAATLIYALVNASRGSIVISLLMFIYTYFYFHAQQPNSNVTRKVTIWATILVPFIFIFIVYGKALIGQTSNFIETGNFDFTFEKYEGKREVAGQRFVSEFSHAYESLNYLLNNEVEFNYFKHFFTAPLNVIPSKLFGVEKPERITEVNSKNISGVADVGRPPGLIASFWFGGGVYTVFIALFFYGFILATLQRNVEKLSKLNPLLTPYFIFVIFTIPWQSGSGDPSIILKSNTYLFSFIFIFYLFLSWPHRIYWRKIS